MKDTQPSLGPLGLKFFALMQMRNQDIVRLGELQLPLGINASQERKLLQRLSNRGYLLRLQRGIYVVPQKIPAGGYWQPNEYYLINKFMDIHHAKYYIGGMAAFHYHGLTEQIPNQYLVYNDKISGKKILGQLSVTFAKVPTKRLIGTNEIKLSNKQAAYISSLARTILDAINDWRRHQKIPEAYEWLKNHQKNVEFMEEFINLTLVCANNNAIRRIGFQLEQAGFDNKKLPLLLEKLKPIQGWVLLMPNSGSKGQTNKKWKGML